MEPQAEPTPETEPTPAEETPPDGFIGLDKHQKEVNHQHRKFRDEERDRVKAEERASTAEKQLDELKQKQAEVVIPAVPDPYSETYQADIKERDEAIAAQTKQNAANETAVAERKQKDEARVADDNAALEKRVAAFDSNMVTHGLNPIETKAAADTIIGYGISDTFQDILLEDPDGPLFVNYLSQNPVELEEMNRMSTLQLVNHLNGEIRPKASLLKPKTSNAPDPPLTLRGGGVTEQKEAWEQGAVYE